MEDLTLVEANLLQGKVIVHPITERELLDIEDSGITMLIERRSRLACGTMSTMFVSAL